MKSRLKFYRIFLVIFILSAIIYTITNINFSLFDQVYSSNNNGNDSEKLFSPDYSEEDYFQEISQNNNFVEDDLVFISLEGYEILRGNNTSNNSESSLKDLFSGDSGPSDDAFLVGEITNKCECSISCDFNVSVVKSNDYASVKLYTKSLDYDYDQKDKFRILIELPDGDSKIDFNYYCEPKKING